MKFSWKAALSWLTNTIRSSWKAILLWVANAVRWLLALLTLAIFAFFSGGSENMDPFSEYVTVDSDHFYNLNKMTWDAPCGTMYYSRGFDPEQHEDYCSSGQEAAFLMGLSALAPTPMLVPAALFAFGGYATENDIRTYYLPFYNSSAYEVFRVSHHCEWFECNFRIRPDLQRENHLIQEDIAYHYPYPQSHVWWYWASAACSLVGIIGRPLGRKNPFRIFNHCHSPGKSHV